MLLSLLWEYFVEANGGIEPNTKWTSSTSTSPQFFVSSLPNTNVKIKPPYLETPLANVLIRVGKIVRNVQIWYFSPLPGIKK